MASATPNRRGLVASFTLVLILTFGSLLATLGAGWSPKLGLDLAGGLSAIYTPIHPTSQANLQVAVSIISNRVNGLGVSGATVNLQGNNIIVSVPGVKDANKVIREVGQTAQLLVRPVYCFANSFVNVTPKAKAVSVGTLPHCSATYAITQATLNVIPDPTNINGFHANNIPPDPQFDNVRSTKPAKDNPNSFVLLPDITNPAIRYLLGPAVMRGTAFKTAVAQNLQIGGWVVSSSLTPVGSLQWDAVAQRFFHTYLAIELDGVVQSAPITDASASAFSSFGGRIQISGSFTELSAKQLALALQFGSLPVQLKPLTTQTVSPTLGHNALVAGLGAGLVGLLLVLLYTIVYYRALGLVIVLGLGVTAAALWAIISALGHTSFAPSFDLAGVTGLIVSIGITVDSYIVYFERLKDETRAGRTVRSSVDRGFKSAWRTVLAADTVSFLAALLLYIIAVGSVRGFAFFLGLSTILDVAVTWYFTRPLVMVLGRRTQSGHSALSIAAGLQAGELPDE